MNTGTLSMPARIKAGFAGAPDPLVMHLTQAANARQRICENRAFSDAQRKLALELLRQQTEEAMRRALGTEQFSAFRAFHHWWFRDLAAVA